MMRGYSKLDCGIVHSTVWQEPHDVRVVWITLLALSNAEGYVTAALPAIAKLADVTIPRMEEILEILSSPDQYSRTKDNDGRRISCIDGGWLILNYTKYREGLKQPDKTNAERQKRYREKHKVTAEPLRTVTQRDSNAYAEAEAEAIIPPKPPKGGEVDPFDPCYAGFSEFWFEYPKKMNKPDSMKAWKQVKAADHRDEIMESIGRFKKWSQWTKDNGKFIPYPASWLRANSWEDVITIDETPEYQNAPDVEESLRQARARMAGQDVG